MATVLRAQCGTGGATVTGAAAVNPLAELRSRKYIILLVLAAGSRLSAYVAATVGEIGFLRSIWMDGSQRLAWLEDYATSMAAKADQLAPTSLQKGIRFDQVSFAYPGTARVVLDRESGPDCNGNGVQDYIDVIEGLAPDLNHNLIPDTCPDG